MTQCIAYDDHGDLCRRPATVLDPTRGGMVCELHDPARHRDQALLAAVLDFCRQRAITPADPTTNHEHERDLWQGLTETFEDSYCGSGDFMDFLDDHHTAITAAMYEPARG